MEKPQKRLILFMPSMDGGGVEKNLILVSNYLSKYLKNISLITYGRKFNTKFNKSINIINAGKNYILKRFYHEPVIGSIQVELFNLFVHKG